MNRLVQFDIDLYYANGISYELLSEEDFILLNDYIGKKIYLGEIEGKHSEVNLTLETSDFEVISTDPNELAVFWKLFGNYVGAFSIIDTIKEQMENE